MFVAQRVLQTDESPTDPTLCTHGRWRLHPDASLARKSVVVSIESKMRRSSDIESPDYFWESLFWLTKLNVRTFCFERRQSRIGIEFLIRLAICYQEVKRILRINKLQNIDSLSFSLTFLTFERKWKVKINLRKVQFKRILDSC